MKANKRILWMLLVLMGMVAMVSCSNDDDDDEYDTSEGVVLRGEEITNEIRDLIVGTWKSFGVASSCYFSHTHFSESHENVKFVFTKNDRALAIVNGKLADKSNGWYEDNSYTLGSEWIFSEHRDNWGKPHKYYKGSLYMSEAINEEGVVPNLPDFPNAGKVEPIGKNYDITIDINTQNDSLTLYIIDSFNAKYIAPYCYTYIRLSSSLAKTGSDDGLVVE